MSTEQRATLYHGAKGFCAYPTNRLAAGYSMDFPPFIPIEEEVAGVVGVAVRKALLAFRDSIPSPGRDEYGKIRKLLLEAAGVRSEAAFVRGARMISVRKKAEIVVTPYRNGGSSGPKKGFEAMPEKSISLAPTVDDVALGEACIQALALCE